MTLFRRILAWSFLFVLGAGAVFLYWRAQAEPVALDRAWGEKFKSLSFAPFRHGQSPLTLTFASREEIEADLQAIMPYTRSVRVYTAREGLENLPAMARERGVKIIQGAWLGWEKPINEAEIKSVIELANAYPDVIERVIVGNENLLRGDVKLPALKDYIRQVRAAVDQPVSYADVWEFWLRNPSLADEVDFITVHFLPYWEDHPVGVDEAMEHIRAVKDKVQAAFPGKPILIGEVGWPTRGRAREEAAPGRIEAARFLANFAHLAQAEGWDYNIVEAFDQGWKTALEGTVGGAWGILDRERAPKFDLASGMVTPNPQWAAHFLMTLIFAALLVAYAGGWRARQWGPALVTMVAFIIAWAWTQALTQGAGRSYYAADWAKFMALGMAHVILGLEFTRRVADVWGGNPTAALPQSLDDLRARLHRKNLFAAHADGRAARLAAAYGFILVWALVETIFLIAHIGWKDFGRYRDFPLSDFYPALFGGLAAGLAIALRGRDHWPRLARPIPMERLVILFALIGAAFWLLRDEGITNGQAWAMAVMMTALGWPFLYRLQK